MKQHRIASLVVFILILAGIPSAFARQRAVAKTEEIVGIVTQASASSLTIRTAHNDRDVRLTSATIVRVDDQLSSVSAIAAGDKIEAHTQKEADGTNTALTIEIESHPSTEVEGTVKSASATSLTVTTSTGDIAIALTSTTRFFVTGQVGTAAGIHAGDHVEVEVREQTGKTLAALVVRVQNESVHVRGTVSAASASSITVHTTSGDAVVALTSSTLIRLQGKVTNASMLVIGSRVEVTAVRNADQTLTATTITVEHAGSLTEIEGSVTEAATDHLRVHTKSGDDVTVAINTDTIIRSDDHRAGTTDIQAGDRVNVDARVNADGTFTALRIEIEDNHGNGNDDHVAELTGAISSISSGSIVVTTGGGNVVTVKIASTTIIRHGNTTLTAADLKAGNHVEVKGSSNTDGSISATEINVEDAGNDDDHHEEVEFSGTVSAVSSTSLTAGSNTAALTSSTVVKNRDHAGSIADINIGQRVEVRATRDASGKLTATQVKIEDH